MDTTEDNVDQWRSLPPIESDTDDEVLATQESASATKVLEVPEPEKYKQAQQSY